MVVASEADVEQSNPGCTDDAVTALQRIRLDGCLKGTREFQLVHAFEAILQSARLEN